jgi:hypothetical protein
MRITNLTHEFVDSFPNNMEEGKIYISIRFRTAGHKCCCGCGTEISTPLRPTKWTLIYDGETVSLAPSIGNRQLQCRSHYVITKNRVLWEEDFWREKTGASWAAEACQLKRGEGVSEESGRDHVTKGPKKKKKEQVRLWTKMKSWFQ